MNYFNFYEKLSQKAPFEVLTDDTEQIHIISGKEHYIVTKMGITQQLNIGSVKTILKVYLTDVNNEGSLFNVSIPMSANTNQDELVNMFIEHINSLLNPLKLNVVFDYFQKQTNIIHTIEKINNKQITLNKVLHLNVDGAKIRIQRIHNFWDSHSSSIQNIIVGHNEFGDVPNPYIKNNNYQDFLNVFKQYMIDKVGNVLEKGFIQCEQEKLNTMLNQENKSKKQKI